MKKKNNYYIYMLAVIVVAVVVVALNISNNSPGEYDEFASCLAASGAKMYGAWWCPHCGEQKKIFGRSWNVFENEGGYVECSNADKSQTQACVDAKVLSYPTWRFAEGAEITGKQNMLTLSQRSGCGLN